MALAATGLAGCTRGQPFAGGSPKPEPPPPPAASPIAEDVPAPMIRRAQRLLAELGYEPGPADGIAGERTRGAVTEFQKARGLRPDGRVSYKVLLELDRMRDSSSVAEAQERLARLGYDPGPADGVFGQRTVTAIESFEAAQGVEAKGRVTPELLERLAQAEAAGARGDTTAATAAVTPPTPEPAPQPLVAPELAEPEVLPEKSVSDEAEDVPAPSAAAEAEEPEVVADETADAEPPPPASVPDAEQTAARTADPAPDLAWSKRLIAPDDLVRLHEGGEAGGLRELAVDANGKLQLTETVSIDAAGLTSYELQEQVMIKLVEAYLMDIKVEVLPAPAGDLDEAAAANGEDAPAASAPAGSDAPAAVTEGAEGQPVEPDSASLQDVTTAYDAEPAPDRVWSNRRVAPGDFVRLRLGGETGEVRELVVDSDGRLQLTDKVSTEAAGLTSYQLQEQVMVKLVEDYMSNLEVEVLPAASAEALPEAN